jgi:membrane protease YdiL (CAAX protease family)
VAAFLILVYGITWTLFLPSILSENGIGLLPFAIPITPFLLLGVIFGITLPVYIVTRVTRGKEGVRELRRRYTHWRVSIGWYLLAIFAPPITALLGASLYLGTGPLTAFADRWQLLFTVLLPEILMFAVLINLWEEGGWTGFLQPRLQERHGPLAASLMVAVAWALVHVPLMFVVGGLGEGRITPDRYWFYLAYLFGIAPPVRVLVTWFWNSTGGSVIIVALLHAAWNTTAGEKFTPEFVPGDPIWVYAVYAVLAVIVIALTRGRLAYRGDAATRSVGAGRPYGESPSRA